MKKPDQFQTIVGNKTHLVYAKKSNKECLTDSQWICLGLEIELMYHFESLFYVANQKILLPLRLNLILSSWSLLVAGVLLKRQFGFHEGNLSSL